MIVRDKEVINGGSESYDICLVSMPYASVTRPSLALGILKSILSEGGLRVKVINANLPFAERIGLQKFELISHQFPMSTMTGEWSFSRAAFPENNRDDEGYLNVVNDFVGKLTAKYRLPENEGLLKQELLELREDAEAFIPDLVKEILATGAKIVGCTSTFEQHIPSLALLRHLKAAKPELISMMGGANCESDMGRATHRNFPWVDYVVSGEADGILVDLCKNALAKGRAIPLDLLPKGVLGPIHRGAEPLTLPRIKFNKLDDIPSPDFTDYFQRLKQSSLSKYILPGIPLETSRGCWWGAIHHCTFCGLNGNGMGFRSKSPERVLTEIEELEARHHNSNFEVVDNILDMSYFKSLLPALTAAPHKRNIFYEVKSNLTRDQIIKLKKAGINWIQPGIESLHSEVLSLMDKGVKGWHNIQLLKWCREFGVRLSWSVLYDFPGEQEAWYKEMTEWVPFLEHLQAPSGLIPLRIDRFSVYHTKAKEFGLDLMPFSAMQHIYDLPLTELNELTYFFLQRGGADEFEIAGAKRRKEHDNPTFIKFSQKIMKWRKQFWKGLHPILSMEDLGDTLQIFDSRSCSKKFRNILEGVDRLVLLACDKAPLTAQLSKKLTSVYGWSPDEEELTQSLERLKDWGYILEIDGRVVNLAVRGNLPRVPAAQSFPGGVVSENLPPAPVRKNKIKRPQTLVAKDRQATFTEPLFLDSGKCLDGFTINYQTYGQLNTDRSNAVLVFHSFTKNAHLAGKYPGEDSKAGWWDKLVGPGKALDTNKYFVICSNALGGSGGSTSPASINPATGLPYAMDFPIITIGDIVNAQKRLIDHLGIKQLGAIVGGCFGGQQALEWAIRHPEAVKSAVVIATTPTTSAHTIAISKVMRGLICDDPNWNNGNYYGKTFPMKGLSQGILAALPIWMSRNAMGRMFGRKRLVDDKQHFTLDNDFAVEQFIEDMGAKAREEFDANSLLYLSKAAEYFDLPYYYGSLEAAFKKTSCSFLFMSYKTDWRYPPAEVEELHTALTKLGKPSQHLCFDHPFGHGAFMYDPSDCIQPMAAFIREQIEVKRELALDAMMKDD